MLSTRGKNIEYYTAFWHWIDRIVGVFGSMAMVHADLRRGAHHVFAQMAQLLGIVDAMRDHHRRWA